MNAKMISTMVFTLLTGCSSTQSDPSRLESDFGNSVRKMQESQIYDIRTLHRPLLKKPSKLDGNIADKNIETYRNPLLKTPTESNNQSTGTNLNTY